MLHSVLSRVFIPNLDSLTLTPLQSRVNGLVENFVHQATDWKSLTAMTVGGMAYRTGRLGVMGLGSSNGIRVASVGLGLSAEVSTFELTHRSLVGARFPRP